MFEEVLPEAAIEVVDDLSSRFKGLYLAGGTGLALQLGHRRSEDLDFFSTELFSTEVLLENIRPEKIFVAKEGTIHCELKNVKLSFLFFRQPLVFPPISWRGVDLANWKDITGEKLRAIADRGSKRDFYDLHAVLQMRSSIEDACGFFKRRFKSSGMNMYHVLRETSFFEDAEDEPDPVLLKPVQWGTVKDFFIQNLEEFEKHLLEKELK